MHKHGNGGFNSLTPDKHALMSWRLAKGGGLQSAQHGGRPGAVLDPTPLKHFGTFYVISHKPCYEQSGRDVVA